MDKLSEELDELARTQGFSLAANAIDDVLTYALFPQIGLKFLQNRGNPAAFEPAPTGNEQPARAAGQAETYTVAVNGQSYVVQVNEGGDLTGIKPLGGAATTGSPAAALPVGGGEAQKAPLAGNIFKVLVQPGQQVEKDELIIVLEAMKMETDIRAIKAGTIGTVQVKVGDAVAVGDSLLTIG